MYQLFSYAGLILRYELLIKPNYREMK